MRKVLRFSGVFLLLFVLTGCTMRLVDFTILSTKNIDLTRAATFERGAMRVEGIDKSSIIIFIPTGVPNVKEAIDRAIESVPGAVALVDGVVSYRSFYIPYIYGEESYIVEGTPLIDPKLAAADLKSNFMLAHLDKSGKVVKLRYVSQNEYDSVKKHMVAKNKKVDL